MTEQMVRNMTDDELSQHVDLLIGHGDVVPGYVVEELKDRLDAFIEEN